MKKRVVITGMGIYSCIGKNLDEVRESLYNGKSGIVFDPERKEMGFRSVFLHTDATNTGAVRFYHNNGFSDERIQFVKEL